MRSPLYSPAIRKLVSILSPVDVVSFAFLLFLGLLNLVFFGRVPSWPVITAINLGVMGLIVLLAYLAATQKTKLFTGLHRFYAYAFVLFIFKEIHVMVRPVNPNDFDWLFIAADHWLFGVNPTQWLAQFANPILTEILQLSYFSYYILFLMLGIELYVRYSVEDFDRGAFLVVYGFYLSYLGYFLLPAVGPRFTLHDFYTINTDLPGVFFTPWIRNFINSAESVSFTMPRAIDFVQRDVFPSGHTELTLIVVTLGHRYRLKTRWIMTVLACLLIFSTVYLRYHYVVDLFGGVLFYIFALWSGGVIQRGWDRWKRG